MRLDSESVLRPVCSKLVVGGQYLESEITYQQFRSDQVVSLILHGLLFKNKYSR